MRVTLRPEGQSLWQECDRQDKARAHQDDFLVSVAPRPRCPGHPGTDTSLIFKPYAHEVRPAVWQKPDSPLPSEVMTVAQEDQPNGDKPGPQDSVPQAARLGATVPPASPHSSGLEDSPSLPGTEKGQLGITFPGHTAGSQSFTGTPSTDSLQCLVSQTEMMCSLPIYFSDGQVQAKRPHSGLTSMAKQDQEENHVLTALAPGKGPSAGGSCPPSPTRASRLRHTKTILCPRVEARTASEYLK